MEKALLDFEEFCAYTGFKKTKAREFLQMKDNPVVVRLGARVFVNKALLDKELERCTKYGINLMDIGKKVKIKY